MAENTSNVANLSDFPENSAEGNYVLSLDEITFDGKNKIENFFNETILEKLKRVKKTERTNEISSIVINHLVPTLPYFLNALSNICSGSHHNKKVLNEIKSINYKVFEIDEQTKSYLQKNENWIKIIDEYVKKENKFIVIDIGGYCSNCFEKIKENYGDRFLGIVEDTENGQQKYEKTIILNGRKNSNKHTIPILSVARNPLKKTEDFNVGKSIVEAAATILRVNAHTIIERMSVIGVFGFGKIGKSIAEHLRQRNVKRVIVYDIDSIRTMEAVSLGFEIRNKNDIIQMSEMIFCATGSKCLDGWDFMNLKNNVFIASCTSNDDEFHSKVISMIETKSDERPRHKKCGDIYQFSLGEKKINLLHKGNAVNFIYGATNGPFIYSVQAGLIIAAIKIIYEEFDKNKIGNSIEELDHKSMKLIANKWLETFENYKVDVSKENERRLFTK